MRSLQGTRRLVWPRTRIGKGTLPTPRVTHSNVAERTGGREGCDHTTSARTGVRHPRFPGRKRYTAPHRSWRKKLRDNLFPKIIPQSFLF